MPESHPEVFISSTSIDLPEHRQAVRDAILSLDFFPSGMEHWPVTGDHPVDLCKAKVEQAAIYLGIYAHRYGWRPDGYDGRSITELEYDWAGEVTRDGKPIPRLCFVMKDDHPWPKNQIEVDARTDLERFKARVRANQVGFFGSPDDLKAQVTVALAKYQATRIHETPIHWDVGATFDNYTLRHKLGEGGNGQVWLADEHLPDSTARPVAIKVLHTEISTDPVRVKRFRREISSMARIDHEHIARVLTHGSRVDQLYVIMPFLPGGTLRARLTGRPLPEDQALRLLEQIGAALDYVHDRHSGLIHRDVKPENILIGDDGEKLVLADFGLVFSGGGVDSLPDEGKPVGTGRYMAPEQWRREPLSRRTDLYALGILAYELLAGRLPFIEPDDDQLKTAHCTADLPAVPEIPADVLRILQKATAKDPADRYPTARAFLTELRNRREDAANLEPRIRDYLNWVTDEFYNGLRVQFVEMAGDETAQRRYNLPIWDETDDLFVRASATIYADHVRSDDEKGPAFVENVRERLLALDRAVLVGEPGSGKSWMLQRLQADYARSWLKGAGRNLVPVRVLLNRYTGGAFADFVKAALDTLAPYHDRLLAEGRLVLLCDALNEMPRGAGQMHQLVTYLKNVTYFVVSCRVRDYRGDELNDLKPLEQVLLRDLELPAIRELVHKRLPDDLGAALWAEMGGGEALFGFWQQLNEEGEAERFWDPRSDYWQADWRTMHSGARLIPLARNPFMGDLLCRTYQEGKGRLPDSRAALFGRFIRQMLVREAQAAARRGEVYPDADEIQTALVALARAMQAAERTVIAEADALKVIDRADAADLVRSATDANILLAQDDGLKFAHQLLQEYFAARVLLEKLEADEAENSHQRARELFESAWWDAGVWRETTIILGEFLGEGARGPNRVARWLGPVTPEVALEVITRNAGGLTQADVEEETREVLISRAKDRTAESDPRGRAAVYRILGLFDADNRPGVGVIVREDGLKLPDIDWVEIPDDGEWTYQEDKHPGLPAFRIARYPVTYAQFQCFVDAPDYDDDRWWVGMPEEEEAWGRTYRTRDLSEQRFRYANHPREMVAWYQAVAFCRWLSDKLDYEVTLPTEQQWEKAARGTDGRVYPYEGAFDAAKGNTSETGIGQTSAVGIFPAGASPYGVLDMSGNVFEWCLNRRDTPDDMAVDASGTRRVLRGGSWLDDHDDARAVYRGDAYPADRGSGSGFRLLRLHSS